jgi:hypothetical protein
MSYDKQQKGVSIDEARDWWQVMKWLQLTHRIQRVGEHGTRLIKKSRSDLKGLEEGRLESSSSIGEISMMCWDGECVISCSFS